MFMAALFLVHGCVVNVQRAIVQQWSIYGNIILTSHFTSFPFDEDEGVSYFSVALVLQTV